MKKLVCAFGGIVPLLLVAGGCAGPGKSEGPRPDLVARVEAGELKVAHASWWGFDAADATDALQAAIRSGAPKLIVDRMSGPWIVRPLAGVSDQEIVFADGAELQAKKGEFHKKIDCLLSYDGATNVVLRGEGRAVLRMHVHDYTNRAVYAKSEWRHGISLRSVRNVRIENLTIAETGGDGIYVCARAPGLHSRDVVIRNVIAEYNNRQGISIISGENILVEGCTLRHTFGTSPRSGIDIEPNHNWDVLKNIVVKDCESVDNEGCGYEVMIEKMDRTTQPLSIRFENCHSKGNKRKYTFIRPTNFARGFSGRYEFVNCRIEEAEKPLSTIVMDGSLPKDASGREIPIVDATPAALARAKVIDLAPGKSVKTSTLAFRNETHLWLYAAKAGKVVLKGFLSKAGGGSVRPDRLLKATVASTDGRVKLDCTEARDEKGDGTFAFDVPKAGFYEFSFNTDGPKWSFLETSVPIAAFKGHGYREPALNGFLGEAWFDVPKGTPSFAFIPAGGGGTESVAADLLSPDGKKVWSADGVAYSDCYVSQTNPPAGLWNVKVKKSSTGVKDDFSIDVLGVPLCFFLTPEKRWTW